MLNLMWMNSPFGMVLCFCFRTMLVFNFFFFALNETVCSILALTTNLFCWLFCLFMHIVFVNLCSKVFFLSFFDDCHDDGCVELE